MHHWGQWGVLMAFLVRPRAVWILVKTEQNKNKTPPRMLPATPCRRHWHTAEVVVCPSAICILTGTGWNGNETHLAHHRLLLVGGAGTQQGWHLGPVTLRRRQYGDLWCCWWYIALLALA
jgi:hypothetical protein